jgi:hypothetical protein
LLRRGSTKTVGFPVFLEISQVKSLKRPGFSKVLRKLQLAELFSCRCAVCCVKIKQLFSQRQGAVRELNVLKKKIMIGLVTSSRLIHALLLRSIVFFSS